MDSSDADLDRIEAQSSTDVSHDQENGTHLPMDDILGSQDFSQSEGDGATPLTGDREVVVQRLLARFRLSDTLPGEDVEMTPETFSGISDGNKECMEKLVRDETPIARLRSSTGDSILHLAVTWGHLELVKDIVIQFPRLLLAKNSSGQTPLHVAAHGGYTPIVKFFVALVALASSRLCTEEIKTLNPFVLKDEDGNTALHLAIEGLYFEVAAYLVNADKDAPLLGNNKGVSSLYMAVEAGRISLVKTILKNAGNLDSKLQGRKHLAHVALQAGSLGILDVILNEYPTLVDERDSEGRTCLSFGVSIEYYGGVHKILNQSPKSVYVRNSDGSFPIHTAAEVDNSILVRKILKRCPDSKYLLNKLGQNVLHIGAMSGSYSVTKFLMNNKDTEHLGVGQDMNGNTPLHLAIMNWHSQCITFLAKSSKILNLRNKSGLRAKDIAELELKPNYIFQERWTLALLLYTIHTRGFESVDSLTRPAEPLDPKNNRDYVTSTLFYSLLLLSPQ
ncbi:protein ACCELERATED CELL DEATH 6 [Capsella rubella]|uniref:protein ACCELERATED CELL DEATH 6 n=1 Tax=Capsella rubella TaxID=81985 RepID=UPI000CD54CD4|nr:protein ACCELERATED CELL DEATH 6 [Capsella rubella]